MFLIRHVAEVYFRSISSISITHDRQRRDESCEKRFCKILSFSKDMFLIRHVAEVYFRSISWISIWLPIYNYNA